MDQREGAASRLVVLDLIDEIVVVTGRGKFCCGADRSLARRRVFAQSAVSDLPCIGVDAWSYPKEVAVLEVLVCLGSIGREGGSLHTLDHISF
jgi:hypothetical protein